MKVIFTIGNVFTKYEIQSVGSEINLVSYFHKFLDDICKYKYTTFFKTKWMRRAEVQQKEMNLYNFKELPTGLLLELIDKLEEFNISYEVIDERRNLETEPFDYFFPFQLDEGQIQSIVEGIEYRRGYFVAATGAGKTAIMIALMGELGGRSLILEPSIDLVGQVLKEVESSTDEDIYPVLKGERLRWAIENDPKHVVCSIPTLLTNIQEVVLSGFLNRFDNVFCDEVHHVSISKGKKREPDKFNGYYKILSHCDIPNRFGFSATVDNDKLIKAMTGGLLHSISEDSLIINERLSKPYIFIYEMTHKFYMDYRESFKHSIIDNEERNQIILSIAKFLEGLGLSVFITLDSKQIQMVNLFRISGYNYIIGQTDVHRRKELYDKFANKEIKVLLSTVAKEGVNIPSMDCVIRAGGIKSEKRITQEKGRGLRRTDTKDRVFIFDFFDDDGTQKLMVDGEWRSKTGYMRKQSLKRLILYKKTKEAIIFREKNLEDLFKRVRESL